MREALEGVLREAQRTKPKPSYSQLLKDLLSRELEYKRRRTIAQRVKDCGLKDYWALESFPWHIQKTLARQRRVIEELAELDFLERAESVVFICNSTMLRPKGSTDTDPLRFRVRYSPRKTAHQVPLRK